MPQLNPLDWGPQLIWLLITFGILYLLMVYVALPRIGGVIEARAARIAKDLATADSLRRETEEAIAAYERALFLDPSFIGAYVNLADAYRQQGRDAESEKLLRRGLMLLPRAPDLHHALGLLLVRKGDKGAAIKELAVAAKLAPDNARYGFVYAVGLHSAGRRGEALSVLRAAEARHPYDLDILGTLVALNREAGKPRDALPYARKIAEVLPDEPGVKQLIADLERVN